MANPLPIPHFGLLHNPSSHLVRAGQVEGGYEAKKRGDMDNVKDAAASLKALATSGHKYRAVPYALTEQTRLQHRHLNEPSPHRSRFRTVFTAIMLLAAFLLLLGIAFAYVPPPPNCLPIQSSPVFPISPFLFLAHLNSGTLI